MGNREQGTGNREEGMRMESGLTNNDPAITGSAFLVPRYPLSIVVGR
jgi:hypothetical protein